MATHVYAPDAAGGDLKTPQVPYDQWAIAQECDTAWWARAREWGGGFFHHPNALTLGPPEGVPLIATCVDSIGVAAAAAGVRWRCRLSGKPRHAYFPSLPIVRPGVDQTAVMRSLCNVLSGLGVSDVACDSFDAGSESWSIAWGAPAADRGEYRIALNATPDELAARLSSHHTRLVHRGDRDRWRLEMDVSDDAVSALARVADSATIRGAARGNPFSAAPWQLSRAIQVSNRDWGVTVCRVLAGDALLSAALIGWGGERAFYLGGGSTPDGYERGAATWMHWRAMLAFRERGITCYNLGGAPAGALDPAHPSHGLHRFKTAFGSGRVTLRGRHWSDGSLHTGLHRAARRLATVRTSAPSPTLPHAS
jgi:hypothetical protein